MFIRWSVFTLSREGVSGLYPGWVLSVAYFCMAPELRIVFKFLGGWKRIRRIFCDTWKLYKIQFVTVYNVLLSHVRPFVTAWTVAHQASLPMGYSRQEYWSGVSCPSPGDLPHPGIEPRSPALAGGFFTASIIWKTPLKSSFKTKLPILSLEKVHTEHPHPAHSRVICCDRGQVA